MPRPTARVLALLEILQRGGTRTVADLAARLDVDERTVRRYVDHLRELEVPVRSVRGRYGGYALAPGYRMPPLMLTDDEALAVLLGLVVGRRAGLVTTSVAAVESATAKVRRVLPDALGRKLEALLEVTGFTAPERSTLTAEAAVLLRIAEAARDRRPVEFTYTAAHGRTSQRVLHPYGVVVHSGRWYATGADSASGEVRTFRVDRISGVGVLAGTFEAPDGFDAVDQVVTGLASAPYRFDVSVRIQADAEHIRRVLPPTLAVLADTGDGWQWARIQAQDLGWLPAKLAALDRPFVVEEPGELRELVREFAVRLLQSQGG